MAVEMCLTPKLPPVIAIIVVDRGRGPLMVLLAPLFAALNTLPAAVDGDVGQCSLSTAQGHLPTSLGWAKHHYLIAGGMSCGTSNVFLKMLLCCNTHFLQE
jgi:hypothetical protein